jgi:hypothetical protein
LLLVLGTAGVGVTTLLEWSSVLVFGPLVLAGSLIHFLTAFFSVKTKERLLHYAAAGLEAGLGFFIMARPIPGIVSLLVVIAIVLLASGLTRLAQAVATQSGGRG